MKINLPDDVLVYVERTFAQCNLAVSKKISKMPNVYESSLDHTFIDQISNHSAPVTFGSGWTVRLDTHFLGGGHHFGVWEIADIGFLVMFRRSGKLIRSKIALLQSKRLYPNEVDHCDEDNIHYYEVGFGRLFESEKSYLNVSSPRTFIFNQFSKYQALKKDDDQYLRIEDYERNTGIPVHYMLYHPLRVPSSSKVPRTTVRDPRGPNKVGCRIVRADSVRQALVSIDSRRVPCYDDLQLMLPEPFDSAEHKVGWRLEYFVSRLLVMCKEGYIADDPRDDGLDTVFRRRDAPISAAIAITFDSPE